MFEGFSSIFLNIDFYVAIVRMSTPLLLGAVGSLMAERAGIVTFSMESMMLMGTVGGIIGSGLTGNAWAGVGLAIIFGILIGLVYGIWAVSIGSHQIVTSVGLNLGSLGITSILYALTFMKGGEVVEEIDAREVNSIFLFDDAQGIPVYVRVGRNGPYLERMVLGEDGEPTPQRANLKDALTPDELTPE